MISFEDQKMDSQKQHIHDEDSVARSIFWPKDYVDGNYGRLDLTQSLFFNSSNQYSASVNSLKLLNDSVQACHELGQKIEKSKQTRNPTLKYTGFQTGRVREIRTIKAGPASFDVKHEPRPDQNAHCHIEMKIPLNNKNEKAYRDLATKRLIGCFKQLFSWPS